MTNLGKCLRHMSARSFTDKTYHRIVDLTAISFKKNKEIALHTLPLFYPTVTKPVGFMCIPGSSTAGIFFLARNP